MSAETTDKQKNFVRVQFDFTNEALQRLDEIKTQTLAATRAETVRNALKFYEWFLNEVDLDDLIIILDQKGEERTKAKASLFLGLTSLQRYSHDKRYS